MPRRSVVDWSARFSGQLALLDRGVRARLASRRGVASIPLPAQREVVGPAQCCPGAHSRLPAFPCTYFLTRRWLMPRYLVERTFQEGLHIPVTEEGTQVC